MMNDIVNAQNTIGVEFEFFSYYIQKLKALIISHNRQE
jgi:hypothetical protein